MHNKDTFCMNMHYAPYLCNLKTQQKKRIRKYAGCKLYTAVAGRKLLDATFSGCFSVSAAYAIRSCINHRGCRFWSASDVSGAASALPPPQPSFA